MIKLSELVAGLKDQSEKHNSTYHQAEPVQFKKPADAPEVDEEPKAEKEQKDVLDRMEAQAEKAVGDTTGVCELTEAQKWRQMQRKMFEAAKGAKK